MDFVLLSIVFSAGALWMIVGFLSLFWIDRKFPDATDRVMEGSPGRSLFCIWLWPFTLTAIGLVQWRLRRQVRRNRLLRRRYG